jgi:TonB family protein
VLDEPGAAQATPAPADNEPNPRPVRLEMERCARPEYPREAARAGDTGTTKIRFQVSAEGVVTEARVVRSSGSALLDEAAVASLSKCSFRPAAVDSRPVAGSTVVEYVWRLEDEPRLGVRIGPNLSLCPQPRESADGPPRPQATFTRIKLEFERSGRVAKAELDTSSGHAALDQAALDAYRRCAFERSSLGAAMFVPLAVIEHTWHPNAPRVSRP